MAFVRDNLRGNDFRGFGTDVTQIVSAKWPGYSSFNMYPGSGASWLVSKPRSGILRISAGLEGGYSSEGPLPITIQYGFYPEVFELKPVEILQPSFIDSPENISQFLMRQMYKLGGKTLELFHPDPNRTNFKFTYNLILDTTTGIIRGTVYDPNADAKLPFEATYFGEPNARLPLVMSFVTEYARAVPFSLTAPLIPLPAEAQPLLQPAPALAPIVAVVEPTLTPYQPLATVVQPVAQALYTTPSTIEPITQLLIKPVQPTVAQATIQEQVITTPYRVISTQPYEELLPQPGQPTVVNASLQEGVAPLEAGFPIWAFALIGGAALFLFTGVRTKKPKGRGRKRGR